MSRSVPATMRGTPRAAEGRTMTDSDHTNAPDDADTVAVADLPPAFNLRVSADKVCVLLDCPGIARDAVEQVLKSGCQFVPMASVNPQAIKDRSQFPWDISSLSRSRFSAGPVQQLEILPGGHVQARIVSRSQSVLSETLVFGDSPVVQHVV